MNTTRRTFLLNGAKAGLIIASLPLITSCGGVTREDLFPPANTDTLRDMIGNDGIDILHLASLAPNGHNTQPWAVTIEEPNRWIVGTDPDRWLPAVDPTNREMLLSIGTFLENLIIAAESYGYTVEMDIVAETPQDPHIMELVLHKANAQNALIDRISIRRTVRSNYLPQELSAQDITFITDGDSERFHYFPPGSAQSVYLAEGVFEANRIQVYRDAAQEELADWIRWSDEDSRTYRDGLTPASMEMSGFAGWFVRTFYDRDDVLKTGFREATLKKVRQQVETHGGWIIVTSKSSTVSLDSESQKSTEAGSSTITSRKLNIPTLLETGRHFQRMFLKVRERMIALHPMTQMLEEAKDHDEIAKELGVDGDVQFILRTGYLKSYPDPVSLRRPVTWFTQL